MQSTTSIHYANTCCLSFRPISLASTSFSSKMELRFTLHMHTVTEFLETENVPLLEWPPCSPDLNIIENVWHYLKLKMKKLRAANSRDELWENVLLVIHSMWEAEMTETINNLYESMPRRMAAVIAARGGNTKY